MPNTVTLLHVHYQSIHKMHYFLQCSTSLKVIPLNFLLPQSNHRWNIELRQKYMRRIDNVLLINVSLSPLEISCLSHIESCLENLSSTPFQTTIDQKGAPKGRPK